jgi:cell division protein FtsL
MHTKVICYIYALMVVIAGYATFSIKNEVQNLTFQINATQRQIEKESNLTNILKAELSYLQSPKRLRELSSKYLNLANITAKQVVQDPLVEKSPEDAGNVNIFDQNLRIAKANRAIRWRYKGVSKIKTASYKRSME